MSTIGAQAHLVGIFNPQHYDAAEFDEPTRRVLLATIAWFEAKGKQALTSESLTEEWYADFDLKVHAAVRLIRLALPGLRAAGGGSIVNVLNTGAKTPPARSLPTTASRAAGLAITKALSKELGPEQIRVNAIMIGLIESGQWRRLAISRGVSLDELYREMSAATPLGRVGTGAEFADLASFLLSARAAFITGTAINLDGGSASAS